MGGISLPRETAMRLGRLQLTRVAAPLAKGEQIDLIVLT